MNNHNQQYPSFNQIILQQNKILKDKKDLIFKELNSILFVDNEKSAILNNLNKMLEKFGINNIFIQTFFKNYYLNNLLFIREKIKFCLWNFAEYKYNHKFQRIESIRDDENSSCFI